MTLEFAIKLGSVIEVEKLKTRQLTKIKETQDIKIKLLLEKKCPQRNYFF